MKGHKFTWFDALAAAVILLLIAGTCVKFLVLDPTARQAEAVELQYQVQINGIRNYTVEAFQLGDVLYDEAGKHTVGVISAVEVRDGETTVSLPDGTLARVPLEDRYDVTLTVSARGIPDGESYKVGEYNIMVNQSSVFYSKYAIFSGWVVSLGEKAA